MTIIEQYHAAKQDHPNMLLLFRVGDEYQVFDEDARTVGNILDLTITTSDNIAMTTFPHSSLETHLRTLLQAGHRVAILDQVA